MPSSNLVPCVECGKPLSPDAQKCVNTQCGTEFPRGVTCLLCEQAGKKLSSMQMAAHTLYDTETKKRYYHRACYVAPRPVPEYKPQVKDIICPMCSHNTGRPRPNSPKYYTCPNCGHHLSSYQDKNPYNNIGSCALCGEAIVTPPHKYVTYGAVSRRGVLPGNPGRQYHEACLPLEMKRHLKHLESSRRKNSGWEVICIPICIVLGGLVGPAIGIGAVIGVILGIPVGMVLTLILHEISIQS